MNIVPALHTGFVAIERADDRTPILVVTGASSIALRAGTAITIGEQRHVFEVETPVAASGLIAGEDYAVRIADDGLPFASLTGPENPVDAGSVAGFHFAPGGNALARSGGDSMPAINPASVWDIGFRPACPDPRGMTLVEDNGGKVWIDIYLLNVDHERQGTSRCGVKIADGRSLSRLNYHDAKAILEGHGKRLPSYAEFAAAAFGVIEKSSADKHPKTTGLDKARTSRAGVMQATGNLWVWGTDGDPDEPRASFFGGSWIHGGSAGSRSADLGDWPVYSYGSLSARGASDHLTA